jgi:periplasmic protein TonB
MWDEWRTRVDFAEHQRKPGRHAVGIGIVLALHALLGYALVTGLAQRMVEVIKAPIETKIIEEVKPPPPPPPENLPPPPKFAPPPPSYVPPPEVNVTPPPTPQPVITTVTTPPPPAPVTIAPPPSPVVAPPAPPAPAPPPAPPPPAPPRVVAKAAIGDVQSCKPEYPSIASKAEITGTTRIRFNVGADGKLVNAEVVKSSGVTREHRALDRAAVSGLSACSFKAGVDENGKAVGGSFEVIYEWKLE